MKKESLNMDVTNAVSDFGRSIGIDLQLDADGLVALELQENDLLNLEESGHDLLVYRVVAFPYIAAPLLMGILQSCNARLQEGLGWQLQVGLAGSGADSKLIFLYRLKGSMVSVRGIEQAIAMIEVVKQRWSA
jgi:hypothetical protein